MNSRKRSLRLISLGFAAVLVAGTDLCFAAEPASPGPVPSKEMREKMAVVHEQIAACLRSTKSMTECRTQAMQKCQETMGQQGCQGMGMGHDMGMGHMGMGTPGQPAPGK